MIWNGYSYIAKYVVANSVLASYLALSTAKDKLLDTYFRACAKREKTDGSPPECWGEPA